MTHPTYTELLSAITTDATGAQTAHVTENWMQGRTTYGGLTAALCLNAALPLSGDRPVRCAQIAFVGPVSGAVVSTPTLLREGKNSAFVSVRMMGEAGVAAEAIFTFGAARSSTLAFQNLPMADLPGPDAVDSYFGNAPQRPHFTNNFNMRLADGHRPMAGVDHADMSIWMRHKDPAAKTDATALLAIGDAPPPAAMAMFTQPGRISSMTWMAEFLTDDITTTDGWFLARHIADASNDGYCSQAMTMWNRSGAPMMIGRQTIALFV